jgi:hypothetical protein
MPDNNDPTDLEDSPNIPPPKPPRIISHYGPEDTEEKMREWLKENQPTESDSGFSI